MSHALPSAWPLLANEAQRSKIFAILEELEEKLGPVFSKDGPSLAEGAAGRALFLGYLSRLSGKASAAKASMAVMGHAVEHLGEAEGAGFFDGYAGIAWAMEHLQAQVYVPAGLDTEEEDGNQEVDEVLLDLLSRSEWKSDLHLTGGLVGYGVYALERLEKPEAKRILGRILDHLESTAIVFGKGLSWWTSPDRLAEWQQENSPDGYYNLGLAHGVPGVLLLLAAMKARGVESERSGALLEKGMAWMWDQVQPLPLSRCGGDCVDGCVGAWVNAGDDVADLTASRIAWCYGDLGVSLALWQVGRLSGCLDWENKALEVARTAAARPFESSGVMDAGLCHGSAGNVLLFLRHFQNTGEECFRDAALRYLDKAIACHRPGRPFAGFAAFRPDSERHAPRNLYQPTGGLMEGASGVGLALLAAVGVEPVWDRMMLLSLGK